MAFGNMYITRTTPEKRETETRFLCAIRIKKIDGENVRCANEHPNEKFFETLIPCDCFVNVNIFYAYCSRERVKLFEIYILVIFYLT